MEIISRKKLIYTKDVYINISDKMHLLLAKEKIMLLAGEDSTESSPLIAPVVVFQDGRLKISDRVYASASEDATVASIFMMEPLVNKGTSAE